MHRRIAGAAALAAGVATGVALLSSGGAAQNPDAIGLTAATNPGAAPQLHVSGNKLVTPTATEWSCTAWTGPEPSTTACRTTASSTGPPAGVDQRR